MTQLAERRDTYLTGFEAFRRDPVFGQGPLARAREAAFEAVSTRGFPTTRDEEWRHTNIAPLTSMVFERPSDVAANAAAIASATATGLKAGIPIVILNGRVVSTPSGLPAGVSVQTVADASASALVPQRAEGANVFVDLNTAFFEDIVSIEIAPGVVLGEPLHVMFVSSVTSPTLLSARLVIVVGEHAQASVVESYLDEGAGQAFTNAVTDVQVGPAAILDHVKYQRQGDESFHIATMFARLDRTARFTSHSLVLGGRIARNDVIATLAGEGAECTLNGLYVAAGDSLVDNHTTIDHAQAHCPSHEVYKGILAGRARAVFNGKIMVRQDAQKTDAKQTNKALLLTDTADQHQAAARDFCGRREMHARRGDRPA
jgi:Fe-S cluster assembly protein SufD